MRDRQAGQQLHGGSFEQQQFNNRLSFTSQKRPFAKNDNNKVNKNTKKTPEYDDDDDGDVVFAY